MRLTTIFPGLAALVFYSTALATGDQTAALYIQPISQSSPPAPALLAEIQYNVFSPQDAQVASFEFPDLPEDTKTFRVGTYDAATDAWTSSTSVASVDNFGKGYSPALILTVDLEGKVVGSACRAFKIDAGQTRDFGPQAVVRVVELGRQPELNKPVVLGADGKKGDVGEEKTLLQKYWWVMLIVVLLTLTGGGDGK
ncbi:uncharacterized protein BCR38DRAFT_485212 [Pseudomassariella vexata]|uniref:Cyclin-dependent protein kinase regulator pho80 n=1 Tax=Pseudomassariella vexata TaxID=1141098 RepID=A0A1Y2DYB2_9PEZI|nr:uncharacterized protein BCR38DRAFT_485212 [Pseudomassariella vexata]ORY64074.1 hypothetical protein BCR38DRAFT_485212 [Pseudomassariella vexata]